MRFPLLHCPECSHVPHVSLSFNPQTTPTNLQSYGYPFLDHSYFYHLIRIDHRHNFSPYNTLLYLNSSPKPTDSTSAAPSLELERLAFLPQLLLSAVLIPLALAKKDLPSTMLAQTFAFVAFNKVCTSQVSPHCRAPFRLC